MSFNGWGIPEENWSKLPHVFIAALPLVETLAEMKVILYVLRHTWGYQDDEKRISIDEFVHGRKYAKRHREEYPEDGDRIDNGTGMCENAIKDGIARAVAHGFIEVWEDDTDKARIKHFFSLSIGSSLEGQKLTPRPSKIDPLPSEVDPRSKKETIERNSEKELGANAPASTAAPYGEFSITEGDYILQCSCGADVVLKNLRKSRAECPSCGLGLYVYDMDGGILFQPPQSKRKQVQPSKQHTLGELPDCPEILREFPAKVFELKTILSFPNLAEFYEEANIVTQLYLKHRCPHGQVVHNAIVMTQKRINATPARVMPPQQKSVSWKEPEWMQ